MIEHLTCAEELLREEAGTEAFRVGKTLFDARIPTSEIGTDYGGIDSPIEAIDSMTLIVWKEDYPLKPRTGQAILHLESKEKFKIERVGGRQKSSPTWRLEISK